MGNDEITLRIDVLLEEIRRESAEHQARLAERETTHPRWLIGRMTAFGAIKLALIKLMLT